MGRAGHIADGFAIIEETLALTERTEERWLIVELLRVKGELLVLQGAPGAAVAAEDISGKRSTWRAGEALCLRSCAPPQALPGCCAKRAALLTRRRSSSRSTIGSPKGSRRPI